MGGAAAATRVTLRPLGVLREALRVYREHWAGLIGGALLIFVPLALLDGWLAQHEPSAAWLKVGEGAGESALHVFGDVLYAGLVAAAVIAWRQGAARERAIDVARALPWATIVVLDLVLSVGTVVLGLLLVVPGVVFYVYVSLAPSVAKIEHVGVRAALRRSVALVRGSFWRVLAVLALVVVVAAAVEQGLQALFDVFVADALAHLAVEAVSAPLFGLATALTAFELGARSHRGATTPEA